MSHHPLPTAPLRRARSIGALLAGTVLVALFLATPGAPAGAAPFDPDSITSPASAAAGNTGNQPSVAIGADDNPVLLFTTDGPGIDPFVLQLVRCTNPECSGTQSVVTLANLNTSSGSTALALDSDDDPVLAWTDSAGDLRVIACTTRDCSGTQTANVINADFNSYVDMVLDDADRPVLAYYRQWGYDLAVVRCTTTDCSGGQVVQAPDTAGNVGEDPSIALDASGNPVIAYYDLDNQNLKVLRCTTADCSGAQSPTSPVTAGLVGSSPSLTLDPDGNPVVSYWNNTDERLEMVHCTDLTCSGTQSPEVVDDVGNPGYASAIALDGFGHPVVAYLTIDDRDVRVAHCTTPDCSAAPLVTTPDGPDFIGYEIDMALDAVGNPVVAYRNATTGQLRLLRCADVDGCGGRDQDVDLVAHSTDNCPTISNADQIDTDNDDIGDACDPLTDTDDDTIANDTDNCPTTPNTDQTDTDNDDIGDACDPLTDTDDDTIANDTDNCPTTPNTDQTDTDNDDIGDACDPADGRIPAVCAHVTDPNVILGTNGGERIRGTAGNDVILGLGGDDRIFGGGGDDCIVAGPGDDRVRAGRSDDLVLAGAGNDFVNGGPGRDDLRGDRGRDMLVGGPARDSLRGGPGADTCKQARTERRC
jgi:hypothetical protein